MTGMGRRRLDFKNIVKLAVYIFQRDDRKGDKPKKRRTNELEKLLHMDFGPKEGGKRLLTEMENKKR